MVWSANFSQFVFALIASICLARVVDAASCAPDSYHSQFRSYNEIVERLYSVANDNEQVSIVQLPGFSYEGRRITGVAIGNPNAPMAVYMNCGIHAREWISPASAMFAIDQLVLKMEKTPSFLQTTRIFITPSSNPDGYEYTFTATEDNPEPRLWRKNRRISEDGCVGVDLNRNFNGHNSWVNRTKCDNTYSGTQPYSEPETQALKAHVENIKSEYVFGGAIDLHAYSQWIMYPPGYDFNVPLSPNHDELHETAMEMQARVENTSGRVYTVSTSTDFYPASGAMDDWLYDHVASVAKDEKDGSDQKGLAYTVELPPDNTYNQASGFIVPTSEIVPSGWEVFTMLNVLVEKVEKFSDASTMSKSVYTAKRNTYAYDTGAAKKEEAHRVKKGDVLYVIRHMYPDEGQSEKVEKLQTIDGQFHYYNVDHFSVE
eukprot:CFRG7050T1